MKRLFLLLGASLIAIAGLIALSGAVSPTIAQEEAEDVAVTWQDHSTYEELQGPFPDGPSVTTACLTCHTDAATEIHATAHWTWLQTNPLNGQEIGKRNIINNFCVAVESNEARCTSCHVGYGMTDADTFDFANESLVDCVVCHDTTGTYKKLPTGAGNPVTEAMVEGTETGSIVVNGKDFFPIDLVNVAQNVGPTSRETCGSCHFYGGGGDAVKHGDLDSTLKNPSYELDIHMSPDGANFTCATCHDNGDHNIGGSLIALNARDVLGIDVPGMTDGSRTTCESCHGVDAHDFGDSDDMDDDLNMHVDFIACQTCHIPEFARGQSTKMTWDWSTAGDTSAGEKGVVMGEGGKPIYDAKKGDFTWESDVVPTYLWFNGEMVYYELGDEVNLDGVTSINMPQGSSSDRDARLWPFKVFTGVQPYDSVNNTLVIPHLFPKGKDDADAYWKSWDWARAIQYGMDYAGVEYSGEYGFTETEMYWPITHMVAPARDALQCEDCHDGGERMLNVEGVEP